ncbi:CynX/NimT family MFS transporter [Marinobacterium lutimaris]|uniref:MFS transporter, CP family, cyanate transporter n=1 Tax=Marinobacterium lutimaris TaxID=568106 RepID=A0A1H6D379_9GAMM|nr:MFS transporter [Marinobacterium lutimaris]SEG79235.1 MFS transporter, CP family, cyanate transporter [Marinobacterium lutimaris]
MSTPLKGPLSGRPWAIGLAVLGLMLAAINLRGGLVVVGPLVEDIRHNLNFSASQFSTLTTLPLLCFAFVSALVPLLTRKITPPLLVLGALLLISTGAVLRVMPPFQIILLGTLLIGSAIALLNVLIPGLVKAYFPNHTGVMTGIYSVTLSAGAGLGVYLAVPLRDAFMDWRAPMLLWALLPLLCLPPWLFLLRVHTQSYQPPKAKRPPLWRNRRAWAITGYMGLQSTCFYSIATWLPNMLIDNGLSDLAAGQAASLVNLAGVPANLLTPMIATRMQDQRPLVIGLFTLTFTGLAGLLLMPPLAWLWASLIGLGIGGALSLALTLFALRSENTTQALALSAMAQSVGYLIAAMGPLVIGALHDLTSGWGIALALLLALQVGQMLSGVVAARPGTLSD